MKKVSFIILMITISFTACKKYSKYEGVPFTEKEPRDWESPGVFNINREPAYATMISFPDEAGAYRRLNQILQIIFPSTVCGNSVIPKHPINGHSGSLKMIMIPATGKKLRFLRIGS